VSEFVKRVVEHLPKSPIREYQFLHWAVPGKTTEEAVGILPIPGADPKKVLARVMDVDHYKGNVGFVAECRSVQDPAYSPPEAVRFYQRITIPLLGEVHHELVLRLEGTVEGYEVAAWTMLEKETAALSPKVGIRSQYNDGAWLAAPGIVGYALSSCPRREDVGFLKWKAMTAGADMAASKVLRDNVEGMARWAARS
jgi:hypothetical protein